MAQILQMGMDRVAAAVEVWEPQGATLTVGMVTIVRVDMARTSPHLGDKGEAMEQR